MFNSQGTQQLYNVQGSPQMYSNGNLKPYKTPPLSSEMYNAQGNPQMIEKFSQQAAFISNESKQSFWTERSARGFPVGATEWENKGHEKQGWVANDPTFVPVDFYPQAPVVASDPSYVAKTSAANFRAANQRENRILEKPAEVENRQVSNKGCFYTVNGEINCNAL
jgi:hypothetical protein